MNRKIPNKQVLRSQNTKWYYYQGDRRFGPFNEQRLADYIRSGTIVSSTILTRDGKAFTSAGECFDASLFPHRPKSGVMRKPPIPAHNLDEEFGDDGPIALQPAGNSAPVVATQHSSALAPLPLESAPAQPREAAGGGWGTAQQVEERYHPSRPVAAGSDDVCMCPHCWTLFPLEDVLFVARHPDLVGDNRLGSDAPKRFRSTRFTPEGLAIDPGGMTSQEMACPNCHLEVPRGTVEMPPEFFSIVGAPASGKSYYLASLTWTLRQTMSRDFGFAFTDAETTMNRSLHQYEEKLFLQSDPNAFVGLEKTKLGVGELYSSVNFNGQITLYPRPFIFSMTAQAHNPVAANGRRNARSIVLYDNAGEHFLPGEDTVLRPCHHLIHSRTLFFILDPTKDPRFRACLQSDDPQVNATAGIARQDVLLSEAARRIRRYLGLNQNKKIAKQLVIVVSKYDVWKDLLRIPIRPNPLLRNAKSPVAGVDVGHIEDVSFSVRNLLVEICPELVVAADEFSADVTYIPVSALGHSPTPRADPTQPGRTALLVRPGDIQPFWVSVPFLYSLARAGYLCYGSSKVEPAETVEILRRIPGFLECRFQDGTLLTVPEKHAGKVIHNPETGIPFLVPKPASLEPQ